MKRYEELSPLLYLLLYRMDTGHFPEDKLRQMLFRYDGDVLGTEKKISLRSCYHWLKYYFSGWIKYFKIKTEQMIESKEEEARLFNRGGGYLISDTIFYIDRYDALNEKLKKMSGVYGIYSSKSTKRKTVKGLFLGHSVTGIKLHHEILRFHKWMMKLSNNGNILEDYSAEADQRLARLNKLVMNRVRKLENLLRGQGIRCYITINQYDVREVLIVMACRSLGIVTKELQHHPYSIISSKIPSLEKDIQQRFEDDSKKYVWVDEMNLWLEEDLVWIQSQNNIRSVWEVPVIYRVVGCPEINKDEIHKNIAKINRTGGIIIFVPSYDTTSKEIMADFSERRKKLYDAVYSLSQREGVEVVVRYHPGKYATMEERRLFDQYGFKLCSDKRDELIHWLCKATVAFSWNSSVMITARNYGVKCFQVILYDDEISPVKDQISIDEIANLWLDNIGTVPDICVDELKNDILFDCTKTMSINI